MEGPMLQALLGDRFQLTFHRETKQLPVLELIVANGNVKLQPSKDGNCTPYSLDAPPPASAPGTTFCGFPKMTSNGLRRTLDGKAINLAKLASSLARLELRSHVID